MKAGKACYRTVNTVADSLGGEMQDAAFSEAHK